jgi:hypothetical protein
MPAKRFEFSAFLTVEAENAAEAERIADACEVLAPGWSKATLSLDDSAPVEVDDD